ncbi:MAG: hypothetical protein B6I19_11590, partial [Bacteroidetes bacterium 4572_114]
MTYTENCNFKNNIFSASSQNVLLVLDVTPLNLTLDYNLYYCPGGSSNAEIYWDGTDYTGFSNYVAGTSQDQQSTFADPAFADNALPSPDLYLQNIGAYEFKFPVSLFISEVADPSDNSGARFVELYNSGTSAIDFSADTWYLSVQTDGLSWQDILLTGSVAADEKYVISYGNGFSNFNVAYGFDPDISSQYITGDGDDGYFLYIGGSHSTGTLIDAFGVVDEDGTGKGWGYEDSKVVRKYSISSSNNTWASAEWIIRPQADVADMTPDFHRENTIWVGTTSTDWNARGDNWDSPHDFPPDETANVTIPDVTNNPVISGNGYCNDLTLQPGAVLSITGNLTIEGNLLNNADAPGFVIESDGTKTGSLITEGSVSGSITSERYIPGFGEAANHWHLLSSPVTNQNISPEFVNFYFWDEIINTWINSKANGGAWNDDFDSQFKEGKGYMASYKIAATKSFIGVPGTGTYISGQNDMPAITYTSEQGNGWNLLGNPYPSAINWDSITKSENINGSVYVRDGANGQYVNWNGLAGSLSDGEIPPGQGFFVKAEATGQSITIENADRLHSNSNFYKDKNGNETENLLSIKVTGNGYTDKTYIHFRWDATNGYDIKYDAYKIFGIREAPQLYSIIGDEMNASINTLAFNTNSFDVPLHFKNGGAGSYTILSEGIESFTGT